MAVIVGGPPRTLGAKPRNPEAPPGLPLSALQATDTIVGVSALTPELRRISKTATVLRGMPSEYDPDRIWEVIQDALRSNDRKTALLAGAEKTRLIPGLTSIPVPEKPPEDEEETFELGFSNPPPQNAVVLNISPDTTRDRWASTTISSVVYEGPGRMWRVRDARVPKNFNPQGGVRYQIVADQAKFGVMSCRFLDGIYRADSTPNPAGTRWEVEYGFVLTGIPNFLARSPTHVLYGSYVGHSPGSFVAENITGSTDFLTNDKALFEAAATERFDTSKLTLYGEFKDTSVVASNGNMWPTTNTTTYLDEIETPTFMLVTGTDVHEVYGQMNSRYSWNNGFIGGNTMGPQVSATGMTAQESPFPASVTIRAGQATLTTRANTDHSGSDLIVEGVPFQYADCQSCVMQDDTFSLVVRLWPPRQVFQRESLDVLSGQTDDQRAATWSTTGVQLDKVADRKVGIDCVVI